MYQEKELKQLYERLKAQYPQYEPAFSGDCLTLTRLHSKIEITRVGVKLYVNGELYDQFTSEYVDDPDDLYELMEAFLLDLQHAGMKQGNETYIAAAKQAARTGSRFLILSAVCLTAVMIGLIATNSPWLFPLLLLIPAGSLIILKQIRKQVFQKSWVCPSCGQPLPMAKKAFSAEMEYVSQCPHCGKVLERAPDLEPIQREYSPGRQPLEPAHDLPAPGSKRPCMIAGGITITFALFLLPLIFIPDGNEPLDMAGVWTGVGMLLYLLVFSLALLLCRHAEPEETRQPVVVVRERMAVTVLGVIVWVLGFVLTLMGVIVAGTPPFAPDITAFVAVPGVPLFLLGVWMLLAGRNRALFVFRDNSMWYISSWGRKREFAPGQVTSVRLTANRSIHLLNQDGNKLASIETNMRGIPRFAEWLESTRSCHVPDPHHGKAGQAGGTAGERRPMAGGVPHPLARPYQRHPGGAVGGHAAVCRRCHCPYSAVSFGRKVYHCYEDWRSGTYPLCGVLSGLCPGAALRRPSPECHPGVECHARESPPNPCPADWPHLHLAGQSHLGRFCPAGSRYGLWLAGPRPGHGRYSDRASDPAYS